MFSGFGQNGGGVLGTGGGFPSRALAAELPHLPQRLLEANGGLIQSPETLSFDPPVATLQFDIGTLGFIV